MRRTVLFLGLLFIMSVFVVGCKPICIDTDRNSYGVDENLVPGSSGDYTDTCLSGGQPSDSCTGTNCYLREASCSDSGVSVTNDVLCANGCSQGGCLPAGCINTDSGELNEYFVAGGALDNLGNRIADECSSGSVLKEAICNDAGVAIIDDATCDNGCEYGACIPPVCTDSDGGKYFYQKGTTTVEGMHSGGEEGTDYCIIENVGPDGFYEGSSVDACSGANCYAIDHYCEGGNPSNQMAICPAGCRDGACIQTDITIPGNCRDIESQDLYVNNRTIYRSEENELLLIYDSCEGDSHQAGPRYEGNYLWEVFCNNGALNANRFPCPNGCRAGACLSTGTTPTIDLANYPEIFIQAGRFNGILIVGTLGNDPAVTAQDIIAVTDIVAGLQEYSKSHGGRIEVGVAKLDTEVSDLYAQNSIVVGKPTQNIFSAQLLGVAPGTPIDQTSVPFGKGLLKLYTHDSGKISLLVTGWSYKDTRNAATALANDANLVGQSMEISHDPSLCLESDDGANYNLRGTVSAPNFGTQTDSCFGENSMKLMENYCEGNQPMSIQYPCPNSCRDGACLP